MPFRRIYRNQVTSEEPYSLGEKIVLGIGILIILGMCACVSQMVLVSLGGG